MKTQMKIYVALIVIAAVAVVWLIWWLVSSVRSSSLSLESDSKIELTPQQISSIKSIGEWEFLSVADEVMVDTTRKGIFTDDHLVRIYYGTLRLGINMHQAHPGWIVASGDTVRLTLPPIHLLDNDFIDETLTRSFFEEGKWAPADREALYRRADSQMRTHALTPSNINSARLNAERQFRSMMQALGFKHIEIRFESNGKTIQTQTNL